MKNVKVHPEVDEDIVAIAKWYNEIDEELTERCLEVIYYTMREASEMPLIYSTVEAPYRRAICKAFPYKVIFEPLEDGSIYVLTVIHQNRHPDTWKERVD